MWLSKYVGPADDELKARSARDWPKWKKWITVVVVAIFAFQCTFAAAIIAPSRDGMAHDFHVGLVVATLPFALFNLGLALGSVVTSTLSEVVGRVGVYAVCVPGLLLFTLGAGFSHTLASVTICRFFAGLFASPSITIASAVIADLYPPEDRGVPLFTYYSMPWTGSVVGPLIGYLVVAHKPWQWTQWVFLMISAPLSLICLLLLEETYEAKLLVLVKTISRSDEKIITHWSAPFKSFFFGIPDFFRRQVLRPVKMLCTELIVALVCLYAGFNFGLVYSLIIASPDVFAKTYGFGYTAQGLSFIGMIIGCLIGCVLLIIDNKFFFQTKGSLFPKSLALTPSPLPTSSVSRLSSQDTLAERSSAETLTPPSLAGTPEKRLHGAMFGGCILPIGLIWFAWTARPSIHWICPIISQTFITCGALTVYVSFSTYLVDTYGPKYGASAQAASTITRYTFAAGVPLFITPMYNGLGTGWATSLLALCALLLAPIPFFFYLLGAKLRARCKFERT